MLKLCKVGYIISLYKKFVCIAVAQVLWLPWQLQFSIALSWKLSLIHCCLFATILMKCLQIFTLRTNFPNCMLFCKNCCHGNKMTEIANKCKEINYMYSKPMSGLKLKLNIWQNHEAMIKIEELGFLHAFVIISLVFLVTIATTALVWKVLVYK